MNGGYLSLLVDCDRKRRRRIPARIFPRTDGSGILQLPGLAPPSGNATQSIRRSDWSKMVRTGQTLAAQGCGERSACRSSPPPEISRQLCHGHRTIWRAHGGASPEAVLCPLSRRARYDARSGRSAVAGIGTFSGQHAGGILLRTLRSGQFGRGLCRARRRPSYGTFRAGIGHPKGELKRLLERDSTKSTTAVESSRSARSGTRALPAARVLLATNDDRLVRCQTHRIRCRMGQYPDQLVPTDRRLPICLDLWRSRLLLLTDWQGLWPRTRR